MGLGNKIREEIFTTSIDTKQYKRLKKLHEEDLKEHCCSTCVHYDPVDPYLPGFITVFPLCKLSQGIADTTCHRYLMDPRQAFSLID